MREAAGLDGETEGEMESVTSCEDVRCVFTAGVTD